VGLFVGGNTRVTYELAHPTVSAPPILNFNRQTSEFM
jgi:hypothetical protein